MTLLTIPVEMRSLRVGDVIQLAPVPRGSRIGGAYQDPFSYRMVFQIEMPDDTGGERENIGVEVLPHGNWQEMHFPHSIENRARFENHPIVLLPPPKTELPILETKKRRINLVDIAAA